MRKYLLFFLLLHYITIVVSQTQFEDISQSISFSDIETAAPWGSGISASDIDNDGDIDVFLTASSNSPNLLLINEGSKSFKQITFEKNWDASASLWIDYDGDKLQDLLVAGNCPSGTAGCQAGSLWKLYKQSSNHTFTDVTEASKIGNTQALQRDFLGGLSAGDLNLDGYLDVVISYWTGPTMIYMNNGDGTFTNTSDLIKAGDFGVFWQPLIYDLDEDGWPEIYLIVEFGNPNQLWTQHGDLHYANIAPIVGLDSQCDDMGIAFGDVENDGDLDLYIACREFSDKYNPLLVNENFSYTEEAISAGVANGGWAWGTTFLDANNDGYQDLAVTNGILGENEIDQSKFFLNNGDGTFLDVSQAVGFNDTKRASSLISLDFDRDGDLDMIQSIKPYDHGGKSFRFLENKLEAYDKGNYLVIKPRMRGKNHWAIGSKVKIKYGDNKVQVRPITAGISYYGQEPAEAFFGLSSTETIDEVEIMWPGGGKSILSNPTINSAITIYDDDALHPPYLKSITYAYEGAVTLSWKKSSKVETGFLIEYSQDSLFAESETLVAESFQTAATVTNLEPDEKYFFRVIAQRNAEESIPGNVKSKVAPGAVLLAPSNLAASLLTDYKVRLNWNDNSENETGYQVERSLSNDFENAVTFDLNPNITSFTSINLQPGFTYYFRVRSKGQNWFSEYSSTISIDAIYTLNVPDDPQVKIFPNPNSGMLNISSPKEIIQIQILSLSGKILKAINKSEVNDEINLNLPVGIYLLNIDFKDQSQHKEKLIIK